MSDFISGLRGDVVDAAERHARGGRVRRTRQRVRALRPQAALSAIAVAAGVLALVVAVRALTPPQQSGALHIVAEVRLGGQPFDAVSARGSLWVADFGGRIVRLDERGRKVTAATPVDGDPVAVAAADDRVLVLAAADGSTPRAQLYTLDASSGAVAGVRELGAGAASEIAAGAGTVWYIPSEHRPSIEGLDLATGRAVLRVRFPEAATLAVGGGVVWALSRLGTVMAIDATTGELVERLRRVAGPVDVSGPVTNLIAADVTGAWVSGQRDSTLLRIEAGRVMRRIPLADEPRAIAVTDDALWVGYGSDVSRRYRLARLDPRSGKVLSSVSLGSREPKALVPDGQRAWVVASDGTALLVSG